VNRRSFITLLGGAAVAWPLAARAQQAAMPVIGFLDSRSPREGEYLGAAFREGLGDVGYLEGQNVTIEFRWAEGQYDRFPALAAEMVRRQVAVMYVGTIPGALAAKAATRTIPIVFLVGGDPVQLGLVTSFNRPGGNMTGMTLVGRDLDTKRLEQLHEAVPQAKVIAVLVNPTNAGIETVSKNLEMAARALGLQIHFMKASSANGIDTALATTTDQRIDALLIGSDPFFTSRRHQLVALATRYGIPAIYPFREFVEVGGLISYAPRLADLYRQAGIYAGRILKGSKAADLPVLFPTKFELVINLAAAKALRIEVPPTLLARADEVIE
jgi:putative ABC transport system substrate-binding protein